MYLTNRSNVEQFLYEWVLLQWTQSTRRSNHYEKVWSIASFPICNRAAVMVRERLSPNNALNTFIQAIHFGEKHTPTFLFLRLLLTNNNINFFGLFVF